MNNAALIVFLRAPEQGRVKTRLAAKVGDARALQVYETLLLHTLRQAEPLRCSKAAWYADGIPSNDLSAPYGFIAHAQLGDDLGARMELAFRTAFEAGHAPVVIVGTDCPSVSEDLLREAFTSLEDHDAVIGPARDGGYWLLGMRRMTAEVFNGKKWSSDSVRRDTIADLERLGLSFALLPELIDVDTEQDLKDVAGALKELS